MRKLCDTVLSVLPRLIVVFSYTCEGNMPRQPATDPSPQGLCPANLTIRLSIDHSLGLKRCFPFSSRHTPMVSQSSTHIIDPHTCTSIMGSNAFTNIDVLYRC